MNRIMRKAALVVNRRLIWILFMVLCLNFGFSQWVFAENCPNDLVGYWKLDDLVQGKYLDWVNHPNGNDGLCDTGCPDNLAIGVVNAAKSFNGIDDGITIQVAAEFDWSAAASFSIELWVKKNTAVAVGGEVLAARSDPASLLQWKIELKPDGTASFSLISTGGEGSAFTATGSKIINNNHWHHIVAMRDAAAGINIIYVDGQLDGSISQPITYSTGFESATAGPTIGWIDVTGQQERFSGSLDEVAFYSRALTDAEIAAHYYLAKGYCNLYDTRTRILPLGDSITLGYPAAAADPEFYSYRFSLWNTLVSNAYYMDFVGNELNDGTGSFDNDHAGFGGLSCAGLYSIMSTGDNPDADLLRRYPNPVSPGAFLDTYPTDVVLLHIGTNDLGSSFNSQTVADVQRTLIQIDDKSENITVILALIINRVSGSTYTSQFNNALLSMAQTRIESGDKIIVLDMEHDAGLIYAYGSDFFNDGIGGLHPSAQGYAKMANLWLTGLEMFMPQFSAPLIHDAPAPLVATLGRSFQFTVQSDGAPPPTYSLDVNAPAGMTIEPTTGVVTWTPPLQTTGPVTITVKAVNSIPTETSPGSLSLTQAPPDTHDFSIALTTAPVAVDGGGGGGGGGGCFIGSTLETASAGWGSVVWPAMLLLCLAAYLSPKGRGLNPNRPGRPI